MSDNRDVQAEQENAVEQTVQNAEEAQVEAPETEGVELDENAQRIYELETALSEAQATIKEQQDGVLRARADAENARRRAEGEVEKIDFRSTLIRRFDKAPIFVPNSVLSDSEIINFSAMPFRRIMFNVGLIYQTSPETIMAIRKDIETYIANNSDLANADEATTTIRVTQFNDSSIDMLIYCFTRSTKWHDFCAAREQLILEIMKIVKKNGSDFAYPTSTIHLEKE